MNTEVRLNGATTVAGNYIGWAPVRSEVRLVNASGATTPVTVNVRNQNPAVGGQLLFFAPGGSTWQDQIAMTLPVNGSPVAFFVAGRFGRPSIADKDAIIEVRDANNGGVLSTTPLMVRVRKDANTLTPSERNNFVSAFATLNGAGAGPFTRFRDMHRDMTRQEAHGLPGFLPWHRAYLLDLERELQKIDPGVALHYWRFDRPAPQVFAPDFLGLSDQNGIVRFSASNPIQFWRTDGQAGILRDPQFDQATQTPNVLGEPATLRLGDPGGLFSRFGGMETNPHGNAHTSFGGYISSIDTAAKDPLFFLLHANVDRLWAKWQWFFHRFDTGNTATFPFLGAGGPNTNPRIGHNLLDTMWPWNRDTAPPRPPTAPGGNFPPSVIVSAPGPTPRVGDVIDYQGGINANQRLGFDYDDVPFEP